MAENADESELAMTDRTERAIKLARIVVAVLAEEHPDVWFETIDLMVSKLPHGDDDASLAAYALGIASAEKRGWIERVNP